MKTATKAKRTLRAHKPNRLASKSKLLLNKVNRASTHIAKDVDYYVTKNPYRAMGIMVLAGVCVGFLIHNKH